MGTIGFLWHRTLGRSGSLRPGSLGLLFFVVLYAAIVLSTTSIDTDEGTPSVAVTYRVTIDSARVSTAGRALVLINGVAGLARNPGAHRTVTSFEDKRASPLPKETPQEPSYERPPLRADPPPAEALAISGAAISVSASDAYVSWVTNFSAIGQGGYGVGASPSIWTPLAAPELAHETAFANLTPSTSYTLWLQAMDEWGRTATTELDIRTLPPESRESPSASTSGGAILLNGEPFFPLALWDVCPSDVSRRIDDGINLFMGDGCGSERALLARLRGETFAVTDAGNGLSGAPGQVGWYYPDELDGRLTGPVSQTDLQEHTVTPPAGLVTFLTLTNHFYTGADPLALGRDVYPQFAALADVLGFDLYPLQNWCRDDRFDAVYNAQRELEALGAGKPTYQWIEARQMDCAAGNLDPTAASVRAETWLAIAGGADGIGYFPNNWSDAVGTEIRELNSTITELAPALLSESQQADSNQDQVKVGARVFNGAIYVIAVNSGRSPVQASIHVPGLGGQAVDVLDEERQLATSNDELITDTFDPLAVHIYVAAPPGWNTASAAR